MFIYILFLYYFLLVVNHSCVFHVIHIAACEIYVELCACVVARACCSWFTGYYVHCIL